MKTQQSQKKNFFNKILKVGSLKKKKNYTLL